MVFESQRLIFRKFSLKDAPLILELNSDTEVLKYLHERLLISIEDAEEVIRQKILPQYKLRLGRWAMHLKSDHEFIGWCGLKFRPELAEIDLGYRLMQQFWGLGYATEAALASLKYGFDTLHLEEITARAHVENIASLKVIQKIGMAYIKNEIVDDCPVKTFHMMYAQWKESK